MLRAYASTLVLTFALLNIGLAATASATIDPAQSQVSSAGGVIALLPSGALGGFGPGQEIRVRLRDTNGLPCTGLTAAQFEIDAFGNPATMADAFFPGTGAHNCPPGSVVEVAPGDYVISGPIISGGAAFQGLVVKARGVTLTNGIPTSHLAVGPDIIADGVFDLLDIAEFAVCVIQQIYDRRCDMNLDGVLNLQDVGSFAQWGIPGSFPPGAIVDPID